MAKEKGFELRKLYFSISEASEISGIPAHVLRYWESEFPELNPQKGRTGNRLFQKKDMELIQRIKTLLYEKKYTIAGARTEIAKRKSPEEKKEVLADVKKGLQDILDILG